MANTVYLILAVPAGQAAGADWTTDGVAKPRRTWGPLFNPDA